jgi:hypothetical protein
LDLVAVEELLRIRALEWKVGKCLGNQLDLPPNFLYAKVGSRDCSPRQLQIDAVSRP